MCQNNRIQGSTTLLTVNLCSPRNPQALRLSSKTCGFIPSVFSSSPTKQLRFRPTVSPGRPAKKNDENLRRFVFFSVFFKTCHLLKVGRLRRFTNKSQKKKCVDFRFLDGFPISIYIYIYYIVIKKPTGLCPQLFSLQPPPSARWRHFRAAFVANLGLKASLPGTKMVCRTSYSWR